jgi:hypothetical protein
MQAVMNHLNDNFNKTFSPVYHITPEERREEMRESMERFSDSLALEALKGDYSVIDRQAILEREVDSDLLTNQWMSLSEAYFNNASPDVLLVLLKVLMSTKLEITKSIALDLAPSEADRRNSDTLIDMMEAS